MKQSLLFSLYQSLKNLSNKLLLCVLHCVEIVESSSLQSRCKLRMTMVTNHSFQFNTLTEVPVIGRYGLAFFDNMIEARNFPPFENRSSEDFIAMITGWFQFLNKLISAYQMVYCAQAECERSIKIPCLSHVVVKACPEWAITEISARAAQQVCNLTLLTEVPVIGWCGCTLIDNVIEARNFGPFENQSSKVLLAWSLCCDGGLSMPFLKRFLNSVSGFMLPSFKDCKF